MIPAVLPIYDRSDLVIARGEGCYLFDGAGKRYLDFASGIAVNSMGHCHPHLVQALKHQAETLWHCSNMYRMPEQERFAQRLVDASFADTIFFCSTGSEAVETGIKMIRKFHEESGRFRIITMEGGFHGRSLACISAGKQPHAINGFAPLVDGFDQVPFNDIAALQDALTPQTGGILLEPIQGDGGIRPCSKEYLQAVRAFADKHELLLMFDEVQSGMGRTGYLFAHEYYGVTPDILSSAKGIGSGFPLAACLTTERVGKAMTLRSHGSTYGSNPLAMAVGNAVLDLMFAPGFLQQVRKVSELLQSRLQQIQVQYPALIMQSRGVGLLLGLELAKTLPAGDFVKKLRSAGLMTAPAAGNVVRLLPPLIISESHIDEAMDILARICKEYAK